MTYYDNLEDAVWDASQQVAAIYRLKGHRWETVDGVPRVSDVGRRIVEAVRKLYIGDREVTAVRFGGLQVERDDAGPGPSQVRISMTLASCSVKDWLEEER